MVLSRYFQIFIPLICLAVNVIAQMASFRAMRKLGLLRSEYAGFFTGLFMMLFLEFFVCSHSFLQLNDRISIFAVNILVYCALGYCYFHFVNLGETARRIRIMTELFYSKDGLTEQEILKQYNANEIIGRRLRRLLDHGQVVEESARYRIGNPLFLLMARGVDMMKLAVFGKETRLSK
jgi:hypothetical protein